MNVVWSIIIFYNLLSPHGNSREELVVLICSFASTQKIDDVSHIFSPPWICCGSQAMCLGCRPTKKALNFTFLHFSLPSCHQLITRITFGEHFWNSQKSGIFPPHFWQFWLENTGRRIAQSAGGSPLPNQGRTLKAETTGSQGRWFCGMKLTLWSCDVFFWLDGFWPLNHQVGEKMKHSKHRNLMFEHFATVVLLYSLVKDLLLPAFAQFFGASFKSSMSKPAVAVARCNRPTPSWRRKSRRCRCLTAPDWTNECQPSRVGLFQRKVCFSSITVSGYIHDFSDLEMLTKNRYSPSIHHPREPKYN